MLYYFTVLKQYQNEKLREISNTCNHLVLLELYTLETVRSPGLENAGISFVFCSVLGTLGQMTLSEVCKQCWETGNSTRQP